MADESSPSNMAPNSTDNNNNNNNNNNNGSSGANQNNNRSNRYKFKAQFNDKFKQLTFTSNQLNMPHFQKFREVVLALVAQEAIKPTNLYNDISDGKNCW